MTPGFTLFNYDSVRDGQIAAGATISTGWMDATGIDSILIRGNFSGGTTQVFVDQGRAGTGAAILTSGDVKNAVVSDGGALVPVPYQWVQVRIVQTVSDTTLAEVAIKAPLVAMTLTTGPSPPHPAVFSKSGALVVGAGTGRFVFARACTIVSVRAVVNTAPTGASLIVDVNKNGTTIFTTQGNRPTISAGSNASTTTMPDITSLVAGDYLTVDIDQVGSTVAGSDLTVLVEYTVN